MSIDLSLDRLQRLVTHLPPYTRPTLHVAGTNGKGSVASLLSTILLSSSLSVGRYNSPHLVSIYDCITLNNKPVDPAIYDATRAKVVEADTTHGTRLSSFELLTLTALSIFEEARVDVAVVEVGLGGRLDATNIIPDESIAVSLLTAVDLDHQAFLGSTVSEIAREKAGIARPGRPFVLGPQKHTEVVEVAREVVEKVGEKVVQPVRVDKREWDEELDGPSGTPFSLTKVPFTEPSPQPVTIHALCFDEPVRALLPLYGEHQLDNLRTAVAGISALLTRHCPLSANLDLASRITPRTLAEGIKNTRWPGRLSFHILPAPVSKSASSSRPLIVLADGAHNPGSSATLSSYITHLFSVLAPSEVKANATTSTTINLTYILGLSHSPPKTPLQTLLPLLPPSPSPLHPNVRINVNVACVRFTPPEGMPWIKTVPPEETSQVVRGLVPDVKVWIPDERDASGAAKGNLQRALEWAASLRVGGEGESELVVVAGSLYLVADLYRLLEEDRAT